jgi:hypothetical protein
MINKLHGSTASFPCPNTNLKSLLTFLAVFRGVGGRSNAAARRDNNNAQLLIEEQQQTHVLTLCVPERAFGRRVTS